MKIKLTLTILFSILICAKSFAQITTLINNFKPAYAKGDVNAYIDNAEGIIYGLKTDEKIKGQRILRLFKVLTGNEQDITTIDFNKAINEVGLNSILEKNINADLSLISVKCGSFRSYLVFNQSKKMYKFGLKGLYKTSTRTESNNFDGGIYEYHCRIIKYTITPYIYSVTSVSEIPSIF